MNDASSKLASAAHDIESFNAVLDRVLDRLDEIDRIRRSVDRLWAASAESRLEHIPDDLRTVALHVTQVQQDNRTHIKQLGALQDKLNGIAAEKIRVEAENESLTGSLNNMIIRLEAAQLRVNKLEEEKKDLEQKNAELKAKIKGFSSKANCKGCQAEVSHTCKIRGAWVRY